MPNKEEIQEKMNHLLKGAQRLAFSCVPWLFWRTPHQNHPPTEKSQLCHEDLSAIHPDAAKQILLERIDQAKTNLKNQSMLHKPKKTDPIDLRSKQFEILLSLEKKLITNAHVNLLEEGCVTGDNLKKYFITPRDELSKRIAQLISDIVVYLNVTDKSLLSRGYGGI